MSETKSVKGIVHSSSTGQLMKNVSVMITGGSYQHSDIAVQSDEQGVFYLPEVKVPGTYDLQIRHDDQSKTIEVHLNKDSVISILF
jgi:carboxypeptidase family protein